MKSLYRLSLAGMISVYMSQGALAQPMTTGINLNDGSYQGRVGRELKLQLTAMSDDVVIDIDGRVDEAVWSQLPTFSGMGVVEPETLAPAPYDTRLRVFYNSRGIYMSAEMDQPPETLVRRISARDNRELTRDRLSITLDTSGEGQFGYWVSLALGDNQMDGTILPERQYNSQWDGAWYGATAETATGWSAEYYIPWGQLAMPFREGTREIGFYAERVVAHLNQNYAWPAIAKSDAIFLSNFPLLQLEGVNPRQQWSLFPSVASTYDEIDNAWTHRTGVDLFWRPSSNFQMTATLNPDFGSAEADDVDVNLTASETFFPEKRLFFQEGQEVFNTSARSNGSTGKRFTILNTRRIGGRPRAPQLPTGVGLSARERLQNADLLGAVKATGQAGSFRYGVLAASEDDTRFRGNDGNRYEQSGRDFTAFRLLYEDQGGGAAYRGLGYIGTLVAHSQSDAQVHAVDYKYLTQGGVWNFDGQVVTSDSDQKGQGYGAFTDIIYTPRVGFKHTLNLTYLDDTIDINDFGYQERNNVWEAWYRFEWVKTGLTRVRDIRVNPFLRYEENLDGDRTNNAIPVLSTTITLNNLDRVNLNFQHFPKRYDDLNSFGNGAFATRERTNFSASYSTNAAAAVSYNFGAGRSTEFAGGYSERYDAGITWRPVPNFSMSGGLTYQDRDGWLLHQGGQDFTTFQTDQWETSFKMEYFISARQQLTMGLQWVGIKAEEDRFFILPKDAPTRNRDLVEGAKPPGPTDSFSISNMNFQVRYRWEIAPLSDLFVVYSRAGNQRRTLLNFGDQFTNVWEEPLDSKLVIKLRYRLGT
ncbi:MAG: DUF5916 domain-containing protein [Pseudohongiella sp.]|nr:DUF5916 domain-containing protein [Pseudohongiella sp.]MDO9520224.1 DUF5916 domain-containing protein [Pseudohongiella sp.]MDP2127029.1 DUF5916 domain-containing protein [Pseudohongiella sp.]